MQTRRRLPPAEVSEHSRAEPFAPKAREAGGPLSPGPYRPERGPAGGEGSAASARAAAAPARGWGAAGASSSPAALGPRTAPRGEGRSPLSPLRPVLRAPSPPSLGACTRRPLLPAPRLLQKDEEPSPCSSQLAAGASSGPPVCRRGKARLGSPRREPAGSLGSQPGEGRSPACIRCPFYGLISAPAPGAECYSLIAMCNKSLPQWW